MNNSHWDLPLDNHPNFNKMDVKVSSHFIEDITNRPWNPKNNVGSAHILCFPKNEKGLNTQLCSMYNKPYKWYYAANNLPERCSFCYVPLNQQNQIVPTNCCKAQLIKAKMCQRYCRKHHHSVTMWRIVNIYSLLSDPNLTLSTLYQCIMSIKSIENLCTQDDGTVVVTCDKSMKEEAEAF